MKPKDIIKEKGNIWIFGYGSLVWKPDFKYKRSQIGFIEGYKRRFWHGDDFYRGDKEKPGRVVTLVPDHEACTWGVAYEVADSQVEESLQYLDTRETVGGGYVLELCEFTAREGKVQQQQQPTNDKLLALVYIATSDNPIYLGPAPDSEIAAQIAACRGSVGLNMEYLLRLAQFMRCCCPDVDDEHLFSIEAAALALDL
ncbi:unnamed protein product [Boreogadus saida]